MKTIETSATVADDGRLTAQMPPDVSPGEHQVVIVIKEETKKERPPLNFPVDNYGPWPSNLSLKREDLYGDGR